MNNRGNQENGETLVLPNPDFVQETAKLLSEGYTVTLSPKGRSMTPFIREGRDKVILQKAGTLRQGDIVLASVHRGYVLHRIVRIEKEGLVLMGDGNCHDTECCSREEIVGKAYAIIRNEKTVVCDTASERIKATLWRWLLPVRRYLIYIYNRL